MSSIALETYLAWLLDQLQERQKSYGFFSYDDVVSEHLHHIVPRVQKAEFDRVIDHLAKHDLIESSPEYPWLYKIKRDDLKQSEDPTVAASLRILEDPRHRMQMKDLVRWESVGNETRKLKIIFVVAAAVVVALILLIALS